MIFFPDKFNTLGATFQMTASLHLSACLKMKANKGKDSDEGNYSLVAESSGDLASSSAAFLCQEFLFPPDVSLRVSWHPVRNEKELAASRVRIF